MNNYNQEIKDLVITKKNLLQKIKEKLAYKKQEHVESHINSKWLKAFTGANKDCDLSKQMNEAVYIDEDEDIEEYTLDQIDFESLNKVEAFYEHDENKKHHRKEIASSEELKEIYLKVKENKIDLNEIAEADLFKIITMLQEEINLKYSRLNIKEREKEELEIANVIKENKTLEEDIKKIENGN